MARQPHLYGATFALILNKNNQVLLQQRKNTGYYDGGYSLPAGHIEDRETMTESITHECKEELGIDIEVTPQDICHILHRINPDRQYFDVCFKIENWNGELINNEEEKCGGLFWFDIDELPDYMTHEAKIFINAWKQGLKYSEIRIDS